MGQTTDQITAHIEHTRDDLGSNLQELEQKVKAVTDWKQHFQSSPMTLLGVAFGGGVLLASMLGGRSRRPRLPGSTAMPAEPHGGTDHQKYQALETWDNIKGALIGVAAARFQAFVADVIPGFDEQYRQTEQQAQTRPSLPLP